MAARFRGLLRLDLSAVDMRKGLAGLISVLAFGIFVAVFGNIGVVAALAALFVILADQPGPPRARGLGVLLMTIGGALIALIGVWAGPEHVIVASLLTFLVVAIATLAAGFGPAFAVRGMLLAVWTVVAIGFADESETALQMALAFVVGGLVAAAIIWLRTRTDPEPSIEEEARPATHTLEELARSPLGWFSVLRAAAAGVALWLGASLFPEHPTWAALTVVLVMKPRAGETIASGVLRTIGTILGVLAAELLIGVSDGGTVIVLIGLLASAFGMAALQKVNYAVFVACLTALLVLSEQLATGSGAATAADRLLATLLGAAVAFVGIAVGRLLMRRPLIAAEPDPPSDDLAADGTPG